MITLTCPHCGHKIDIPNGFAGLEKTCSCGGMVLIPKAEPLAPPKSRRTLRRAALILSLVGTVLVISGFALKWAHDTTSSGPTTPTIPRPPDALLIASYPSGARVFILDPNSQSWPLNGQKPLDTRSAAEEVLRQFVARPSESRSYLGDTPCFYKHPSKQAFILTAFELPGTGSRGSQGSIYTEDTIHDGRLFDTIRVSASASEFTGKIFRVTGADPSDESTATQESHLSDIIACWLPEGEVTSVKESPPLGFDLFLDYDRRALLDLLERWGVGTDSTDAIEKAFTRFGQAYYKDRRGEERFLRAMPLDGQVSFVAVGKAAPSVIRQASTFEHTVYLYEKEKASYVPNTVVEINLVPVEGAPDLCTRQISRAFIDYSDIHKAARDGDINAVRALIKLRDINGKSLDDLTPLHCAVYNNHQDVVDLLLKSGACVEPISVGGLRPLHVATLNGPSGLVRLLLDNGANVNVRTRDGFTPLHCAAQNGQIEAVNMLLGAKAEINAKEEWGFTPLHVAASKGELDMVKLLLDRGADVNAKSDKGLTSLFMAEKAGHKDVVRLLLTRGADANIRPKEEDEPEKEGTDKGLQILADPRVFTLKNIEDWRAGKKLNEAVGTKLDQYNFPAVMEGNERVVKFADVSTWYGQPVSTSTIDGGVKEHHYPPLVLYEAPNGNIVGFGLPSVIEDSGKLDGIIKSHK